MERSYIVDGDVMYEQEEMVVVVEEDTDNDEAT